ncbi:MAG: hypothetical protein K2G30_07705, partial [Muribaculaceae bacterium]|nr:hypothetical protein [Muribaculaceae bacterium]
RHREPAPGEARQDTPPETRGPERGERADGKTENRPKATARPKLRGEKSGNRGKSCRRHPRDTRA